MRLLAGIVFFVVAAFGVLLGVIYPWAAASEEGYELLRLRLFTADEGFQPIAARLPASEQRILIRIEAATTHPVIAGSEVVLTMTATSRGRTEIAQVFTLDGLAPRSGGTDLPAHVYTLEGETLYSISDQPYVFTLGPGELDLPLVFVDLVLVGGTYDYDESVPPIGYGLMAIGVVGFALSVRKRREKPENPPPQWGRG